jgi:hypothetical protein
MNDQVAHRADGPPSKRRKLCQPARNSVEQPDGANASMEKQVQDRIECFAQATCKVLCRMVITKLPRELRDLVYEHLVTPDIVYVGPQYLTNEGRPCENDRDAHHWDIRYVGDAMAVELAQTWYRSSLFYFWQKGKHSQIIERFMNNDRWNYGIKPHEHISRVRFDLGDDVVHHPGHYCAYTMPAYPEKLTMPFKMLAKIRFPNRVHFLIRIHTYGSLNVGYLSGGNLHLTLQEIIAGLKGLLTNNHRFNVQWSELADLEFASVDCQLSADSWKEDIVRVSHCKSVGRLLGLTIAGYQKAPVALVMTESLPWASMNHS